MSNPQQMWVRSPKGVYYWRDPTGSVWKEPRDNRSGSLLRTPRWNATPTRRLRRAAGDPAPTPPSTGQRTTLGRSPRCPTLKTRAFPPTGFGAPRPAHQGASIPATQRPHGPTEYQGYTGSFATTMRYRKTEPPRYEEGRHNDHRRTTTVAKTTDARKMAPQGPQARGTRRNLCDDFARSLGSPERRDSVRAETEAHQDVPAKQR
ncbi:hypothetical protein B0H17DRAFT_1204826 [Mycena rosella]|uniref:Uncharacterized protein n=1 Tax=Mycena rosella TaxID=1033263 RepID=A0AAD7D8Y0_MYCRO|nr:hypothetical protein B0H17DRAFT_1204826 [Mycena rosella]